ncbi:hypothetical protein H2248_000865 [Termitomyces sp. 'cryptogamus']|nr:hypothetical protein H2248_000865 [Termitomyces sp. 'cryptogamus']
MEWTSKSPSLEEWEERNVWALGLIVYNTKTPVGLGIKMDGSAMEAWKGLTDNYGVFSKIATMHAKKCLCATKFLDTMDFLKHIKDLREKWKPVTEKGAKIDDDIFHTILLALLLESWNAVVAGVYAMIQSKDLIATLTIHWDCLVLQKQKDGVSATALQAQTNQTKPWLAPAQPHITYALAVTLQCKATNIPTYADSGTTDHFFVNKDAFTNYKELLSPMEGHTAPKGAMFGVISQGTVKKICKTDPSGREVLCGTGTDGMYLLGTLRDTDSPLTMVARSQVRPTTLET